MASISIIIPCYNEAAYVPRLLDRLCGQTVRPHQVIICDSNSTDSTVNAARAYSTRLPIIITSTTTRTPGSARNAGAKAATGEYLLFIDADCLPVGKRFLERLDRRLTKIQPDYASPLFVSEGTHLVDHAFIGLLNAGMLASIIFSIGGTMCVRRQTYLKYGGFAEGMHSGEDTAYVKRLSKANVRYLRLPHMFVYVSNRRGKKDGRTAALLQCFPRHGLLGKYIHRSLEKRNKTKKYGTF